RRGSATKSGNGLQKTSKTISVWRVTVYLLFLLFFCCFGCQRGEKPAVTGFFRANALQPARQRDSNGVGNRLWFSRIFQKGSSICSVTSTNPSGVFSRPLSAPVANPKASAAFGFDSRSQPFCLPYPSNIRGLEKYCHPVIPWFIMSLTSRISHCFGSSKGWFKASLKSCLEHTTLPV